MRARSFVALAAAALLCCAPGCNRAAPVVPGKLSPEPGVLVGYRLHLGPRAIDGVFDNASGLTFRPSTGTLFLVLNGPPTILELDPDGTRRRAIELRGFQDTEGIAYLRDDLFAVAEEGRGTIAIVHVTPETRTVNYTDCRRLVVDASQPGGNTGLEGLTYDAARGRFFGVKEKRPRRIYQFPEPTDARPRPPVTEPWDAEGRPHGMRDLAGICYDPATGNLLVLSDESRCVVECTTDGREMSRLSLGADNPDLVQVPPQPEGIAIDEDGGLYICSEPNLLYVFRRQGGPTPTTAAAR